MKWTSIAISGLLLTNSLAIAAPLRIAVKLDTLSSFEAELAQVEKEIQIAAAKRAKINKMIKVGSASVGVAGLVGGVGYITSAAIPMAVLHRQRANILAYNQEVAQANAATARERARQAHDMPSTFKVEPLTRLDPSKGDLDKRALIEAAKSSVEAVEQAAVKVSPAGLSASKWKDKDSLWDEGHPIWYLTDPRLRAKLSPIVAENEAEMESKTVEERIKTLQDAVLKMRKQERLQPVRDKFSHWMLGLGATTALASLASAELVNENSVEYYMTWPKLADPSNLDMATCLKYAAKIPSLNCSKAAANKHTYDVDSARTNN